MRRVFCWLTVLLVVSTALFLAQFSAVAQSTPLVIAGDSLPATTAGSDYHFTFHASGGSQAHVWGVATGGQLPTGIKLNPHTGNLSGTPMAAGEYHFTVIVSDIGDPTLRVQKDYTLVVTAGLTVDWKDAPKVNGTKLGGSVVVSNHTDHAVSLTVVVVAVNQIGRATTLGYQHFSLASDGDQVIPFGSSPGPGTYYVRADVVSERKSTRAIRRASKQTTVPLVIDTV